MMLETPATALLLLPTAHPLCVLLCSHHKCSVDVLTVFLCCCFHVLFCNLDVICSPCFKEYIWLWKEKRYIE